MFIAFRKPDLRELCNNDRLLRKRYGEKGRKKISQRLAEFDAAANLAIVGLLPGAHCEELKGNRAGEFSVRAHDGFRIIFVPNHQPVPRKPDTGVDWAAITAIEICSIEDYHD